MFGFSLAQNRRRQLAKGRKATGGEFDQIADTPAPDRLTGSAPGYGLGLAGARADEKRQAGVVQAVATTDGDRR